MLGSVSQIQKAAALAWLALVPPACGRTPLGEFFDSAIEAAPVPDETSTTPPIAVPAGGAGSTNTEDPAQVAGGGTMGFEPTDASVPEDAEISEVDASDASNATDATDGADAVTSPPTRDAGLPYVTGLALGAFHSCALLSDGNVRCWGSDRYIGYGNEEDIGDDETPASAGNVVVGGRVVQICAGWDHTCAVLDTGALRCWGSGFRGQLGYGNEIPIGDDETPASAGDANVGGPVKQVACGAYSTCVVMETGKIRCWGDNEYGQLGYQHTNHIGDDEDPATAGDLDIGEGTVVQLAVGRGHQCVLFDSGNMRCWGRGATGALGYGNIAQIGDDETPGSAGDIDVGGRVVQIGVGVYHTCALLESGSLRCWGTNSDGQVGYPGIWRVGDDETPATMGDVDVGGVVSQLAVGTWGTCVVLTEGEVRCWGRPDWGYLGYGNVDIIGDNEVPGAAGNVAVGAPVSGVAMGFANTCALLRTGDVRCWGRGSTAALGYGNLQDIGDDELPSSAGNVEIVQLP